MGNFFGGIVEELAKKFEQFAFHGVLRCKQSLENYLAMDKLVGNECFKQDGLLRESHKQIAEVFLRDIAANIFKIIYDQSSKIQYQKLKDQLSNCEHPDKQKFDEYIKKINELAPTKDDLENFRNKRLAHLDQLDINEDLNSQFIEIGFYKWFLDEVRNHGKLRFMDYMEVFCLYSLSVVKGDSERFRRDCKDIKSKAVIFWAFATKEVKDNSEVDCLLQLSQG